MDVGAKRCNTCNRVFRTEEDYLTDTSRWRMCDAGNLWFNCSCDSTILIKKGKFDWYSPDKTMSEQAAGLFNSLAGLKALPHLPSSILQLQAALSDGTSSSREISELLRLNAFIAADVLKAANNMRSVRSSEIDSLEFAVSFIGRKVIAELALVASLKQLEFKSHKFLSQNHWDRSFLTGNVAEFLNQKFGARFSNDTAYLAGSFCNIGKVAYAICLPDQIDLVQNDVDAGNGPWLAAEKKHDLVDHSILGEVAGAFWGLSPVIIETAMKHHEPPKNAQPPALAEMIGFANQLVHLYEEDDKSLDVDLLEKFRERFLLGDDSQFRLFVENLEEYVTR